MKNSLMLLIFFSGLMIFNGCEKDQELILETTILQGTWVEVEPEDLAQYAGTNHTLTFLEDSFF